MKRLNDDILIRFIKLLNVIFMTLPFVLCWYFYYADRTVSPYGWKGHLMMTFLFLLTYCVCGRIYDAFNISMSRISEMIYSQDLSAMVADGIMFIVIWLLTQKFPVIWPVLIVLAAQFVIACIWCLLSHSFYFKKFPAKSTAIIYDTRRGLDKLIKAYGLDKKYDVQVRADVNSCLENLKMLDGLQTVFLSGIHSHERNVILKYCMYHDLEVLVIPRIGDVIMNSARPVHMFHLPMLQVQRYNATPEYLLMKRLADIIFSLIGLIILSPIMLVIAIAVKLCDHGPVLYKQMRLTKDGKKFYIHKFRSMRVDAENDGVARLSTGDSDSRITPVGRVIRKVRLDELPQLLDILSGNLSFVGPRPERPEIAEKYEKEMPEFRLRLQAKAGLTGYAQVYGQYNSTPYDKLQMDLMYIAHPSIIEDFKIIFATIKILFMADSTRGVEEGETIAGEACSGRDGN